MFTQCSKCETVFRLSADALRAAGGQVRCGRCGEVFNALARLAEDATGFSKGESSLFLETRAEGILESQEPAVPDGEDVPDAAEDSDATPGVEFAQLQFLDPIDDGLAAETSLEFTLPPGELDKIFIETRPSHLQPLTVVPTHPESLPAQPEPLPAHPASLPAHPESFTPTQAAPVIQLPERIPAPPPPRMSGLEVSEEVRREMLSGYSSPDFPQDAARRSRLPFMVWLTAAILLTLLLVIQIARSNGGWMAAHAPLLGGTASPAASLASYQLRQWGVTGDPGAKGTLRVRASIMNTAAQLQPYPLLRVTLVNRFGSHVGAREFEPAEYLGQATTRMLAPGERVDATLDILDPGNDAEGFEIDVCVRGGDSEIFCAGDAAAEPK